MKKSDFQAHPLWETLRTVNGLIDELRPDLSAPERPGLDRVREVLAFSQSVKPLGAHHSRRFNQSLLDELNSPWTSALSSLQSRMTTANAAYTDQAVSYAEATLAPLYRLWAPPAGPAQQAQYQSFYTQLVENQEEDISRLHSKREALRQQLVELGEGADEQFAAATTALEKLQATAEEVGETVSGYETRVDAVVDDGNKRVAALEANNAKAYAEWQTAQAARFTEDFSPFKDSIEAKLSEAQTTLDELRETNREYATLTAAVAANTLAHSFSREALTTRILGLSLYLVGFVLLCLAAVPLVLLLTHPTQNQSEETLWATFAIRAAIGALAASAATVAIRLGSRFVSAGQESKRTELELRAFGPFLANVDKSESDTARLEFVDRAFGPRVAEDRHEESIPVSTFSQILAAVTKLMGR
jgi:hypothetical protein